MNFTPIDNKGLVEGFCIIKSIDRKTSSKGDSYLDITLGDSSGEINAKLWRYVPEIHGEYAANEIVKVRGLISEYNGSDQLRIERIRHTEQSDNVKPEEFVKSADYSGEEMFKEIVNIVDSFNDNDLKTIVLAILNDNRQPILYWPAAFKLHHAVRGGLLLHTLSIVRLAQAVCKIYPFVDSELLISGAILHDVAKLKEYTVADSGIATGYSVEGNLLGHLTMGAMVVNEYAKKLGTNQKTAMLLEHMLLSHHGEPDFGAAVRPAFIEAELLSELDLMDSRVYEMHEAVAATEADDFSGKLWAMDNRKLYNHGRCDLNKKTKIF
ncbi:MAG: HD domain-containing protein [Clostridia bacterium]|nr:HD domain-containing protein [Clostridia bacterium]